MVLLQILHVPQAALAAYGAYHSFIAIKNLRQYEETSKKLAEWSAEAERQLHKTRTTQASGAIAILASFIAASMLAAGGPHLPWWVKGFTNPLLMVGILAARGHIKSYWAPSDGKTVGVKVPMPGMEQYNEAQKKTENLLKVMEYLEYSYVATSLLSAVVGYDV